MRWQMLPFLILTACLLASHPELSQTNIACAASTSQQSLSSINKVHAIIEDTAANSLIILTNGSSGIQRPDLRVFQENDGNFLLTCDFVGMSFYEPTKVINLNKDGIEQIRIGQLQSMPPIMRIAVRAKEKASLEKLSFDTNRGGTIMLSWTAISLQDKSSKDKTVKPATKPNQAHTTAATESKMPPLAPEIRQIQEVKNNSESKNKLVCNLTPYADSGSNFSGTNLEIKASDTIHYKAFYLDNPKRYVLDIENCPELPQFNSSVPQINRYINDIRWGKPYDDQPILRVVFDLTENKSQITDLLSNDKLSLNITFSSPPSPEPINLAGKTSPTPTFPENIGLRAKIPRGKYLIIDPGHGGSDPGAQRKEINEKDLTLGICLKLEKLLERNGLKVLLTRKDDSYISLQERVDITNSSQADAFLSVHINSLETNQAITGIETYYQTQGSKTMAQFIHSELVSGLEANDRRVRQARFYVINHTPLPAVLAEVGFISNQTERDKLASDNYQNLVAKCLYRGIIYYLAGKENGN